MPTDRLTIEHWPLDRVRPYDRNPRHNDRAVPKVVASLREFGFRQPIVVDRDGVIIVGHTRYRAAQELELAEVPVHVAVGLTPEQVKAYRIADNRTNQDAEWDWGLLSEELKELEMAGMDLTDATGFETFELEPIMAAEWTPPAPEAPLGGERRTDQHGTDAAPATHEHHHEAARTVGFSDSQWSTVLEAHAKMRGELGPELSTDLDLPTFLTRLSRAYRDGNAP